MLHWNCISNHTLRNLVVLIFFAITLSCAKKLSQLEQIQSRGFLRVVMVSTPPLYFPDDSFISGLGYDIAKAYAKSIKVTLKVIQANTIDKALDMLKQGKAHIAISGSLAVIPNKRINGIPFNKDEWYMIGNRNNSVPKKMADIEPGLIVVAEGSKPSLTLKNTYKKYPFLYWLELPQANTRQILEHVNKNNFKLSVVSADVFLYYQYLYPEIKIAFKLKEQYPYYLLTNNNDDDKSLYDSAAKFINYYQNSKSSQRLIDTYFRHLDISDYVDNIYYLKRIKEILPKYEPLFRQAADKYGFDKNFLAGVSYQESHWNNEAKSATGVKGLMMLTKDTAKRVEVTDRTDPKQSINGGAKYLNLLKKSLPKSIKEPERSWMTLAAYNIGLGHLEDARILTQKAGNNPNYWVDVEKHLPKLAQEKWYKQTKYGRARGHEAVDFVKKVRRYYDILRLDQQENNLKKHDPHFDQNKLKITPPTI